MCLIENCKASDLFISYILASFLFLWKNWEEGVYV